MYIILMVAASLVAALVLTFILKIVVSNIIQTVLTREVIKLIKYLHNEGIEISVGNKNINFDYTALDIKVVDMDTFNRKVSIYTAVGKLMWIVNVLHANKG